MASLAQGQGQEVSSLDALGAQPSCFHKRKTRLRFAKVGIVGFWKSGPGISWSQTGCVCFNFAEVVWWVFFVCLFILGF